MINYMTREEAYASFRSYEKEIDSLVNKGKMSNKEAKKHIESARKNYKGLNYNKELDRINK